MNILLKQTTAILVCVCAGLGSTALASGVSYQYTDAKSNTILVAGQDGIDHLYQYSAYGVQSDAYYPFNRQSEAMDNAPRLLTIDDNPFGYGGQRRDSSTALWSLGNGYRQYDALTGGFMQADSLSAFSGKNTENAFAYVGGNPVGYRDPTGHFKVPKALNVVLNGAGIMGSMALMMLFGNPILNDNGLVAFGQGFSAVGMFSGLNGIVYGIVNINGKSTNHASFAFGLSATILDLVSFRYYMKTLPVLVRATPEIPEATAV
ncbi:MAG: RHS repeat-associated core domain-containing protein [Francisellaceae bacterium]